MNEDQPARISAPLKWGLAGTVLATLASLIWPTHELVAVQDREGKRNLVDGTTTVRQVASVPVAPDLRARGLARVGPLIGSTAASAAAAFDPFVGVVVPPPPAPPQVTPAVVVAAPAVPPPQDYRFLGKVTGPDGLDQILLGRGDTAVSVETGTVLDNGYVVESLTTESIVLVYPSLGTRIAVPIPKSQEGRDPVQVPSAFNSFAPSGDPHPVHASHPLFAL